MTSVYLEGDTQTTTQVLHLTLYWRLNERALDPSTLVKSRENGRENTLGLNGSFEELFIQKGCWGRDDSSNNVSQLPVQMITFGPCFTSLAADW